MGGNGSTRIGQSDEEDFSWWGYWGPMRDFAAGAISLVRARAAPIPLQAGRARLFRVTSLWESLTLASTRFSLRYAATHIFPLPGRKKTPSDRAP